MILCSETQLRKLKQQEKMPFKMKTFDLTEDINTTFPYSIPSSPESTSCLPVSRTRIQSIPARVKDGLSEIFPSQSPWTTSQEKKEIQELQRFAPTDTDLEFPYQKQLRKFSYKELRKATDNFSEKNLLGEGANGKVYKGYLSTFHQVAVKRFVDGSTKNKAAFRAEVQAGKMVMHRNVILLIGFCEVKKSDKLFLVFPYMCGSLDYNLFELPKTQPPLNWETRKQIALGVAKGLSYLHDQCYRRILNRDVKSSNILLDENFEPSVADFGLALIMHHKQYNKYGQSTPIPLGECPDTDYGTITTRICGTYGYIAPEASMEGKYSVKSDVFAYGVVLLEIISGCRAHKLHMVAESEGFGSPADWIKQLLEDGNMERIVDSSLRAYCCMTEVERLIKIALVCTWSHSPERRPNMSEVVCILEGCSSSDLDTIWEDFQQSWIKNKAVDGDTYFSSTDIDYTDAASYLDSEESFDFDSA